MIFLYIFQLMYICILYTYIIMYTYCRHIYDCCINVYMIMLNVYIKSLACFDGYATLITDTLQIDYRKLLLWLLIAVTETWHLGNITLIWGVTVVECLYMEKIAKYHVKWNFITQIQKYIILCVVYFLYKLKIIPVHF